MTITKRICGQQIDADQACQYWLDSPVFFEKRQSKDQFDFGDDRTVGKCLKRRYLSFYDYQENLDFGRFLGKHQDKWVVGIVNEDSSQLVGGEVFDSLEDLKQAWELD
jgi:hypothetical protein